MNSGRLPLPLTVEKLRVAPPVAARQPADRRVETTRENGEATLAGTRRGRFDQPLAPLADDPDTF